VDMEIVATAITKLMKTDPNSVKLEILVHQAAVALASTLVVVISRLDTAIEHLDVIAQLLQLEEDRRPGGTRVRPRT